MSLKALLAAVLAGPDDGLPRLAYADCREEPGGEAERGGAGFIRVQVGLARMWEEGARRAGVERQEAELLGRHGEEWVEELGELVFEVDFRRGFVECV